LAEDKNLDFASLLFGVASASSWIFLRVALEKLPSPPPQGRRQAAHRTLHALVMAGVNSLAMGLAEY
jgi:hypothetical protein